MPPVWVPFLGALSETNPPVLSLSHRLVSRPTTEPFPQHGLLLYRALSPRPMTLPDPDDSVHDITSSPIPFSLQPPFALQFELTSQRSGGAVTYPADSVHLASSLETPSASCHWLRTAGRRFLAAS
eukprot:scaffold176258_cov49-Attheya_sp.AAC.2